MPYIVRSRRKVLDKKLKPLIKELQSGGECCYAIVRILECLLPSLCYSHIAGAIGVLETAKLELYRRVAAPYEDHKLKESGDVFGRYDV